MSIYTFTEPLLLDNNLQFSFKKKKKWGRREGLVGEVLASLAHASAGTLD